jgi:hypothetical protein
MATITDNVDLWVPPLPDGPSVLKFTWHFRDELGAERTQTMVVQLGEGEPIDVINHVREYNGVFLPDTENGDGYLFLPWPPSSIRVTAG